MEFLKRIYAAAAIVILNTLIAFTALNLLLAVAYLAWDGVKGARKGDARVSAYRERFTDYEAYSQLSHEDAVAMLDEQDAMGAIGLRYRPWVQFGNPDHPLGEWDDLYRRATGACRFRLRWTTGGHRVVRIGGRDSIDVRTWSHARRETLNAIPAAFVEQFCDVRASM